MYTCEISHLKIHNKSLLFIFIFSLLVLVTKTL
nr:MAG TPA: hypothetical protein [Caudoviricetes sp.]